MEGQDIKTGPRILVSPLDWGLGHATRCIPIIRELVKQKCNVIIAAEGRTEALLRQEFPSLEYIHLKGYQIEYGRNKWELLGKITMQIPKILERIDEETTWLEWVVNDHKIDAVISDNRYGLHHDEIPCAFMSHQLLIKTPLGKFTDGILQKFNYDFIEQFSECWIPDMQGEDNLAGELSHPEKLPSTEVHYIGPLTRFDKNERTEEDNDLLIILSGPEPQRSILEETILSQINSLQLSATMVRGLPGKDELVDVPANLKVYNHLTSDQLEAEISKAKYVISRAGYSSVMDLLMMNKKSILIATPGQSEQEYLASHLMERQYALCISQDRFRLNPALVLARSFNYKTPQLNTMNKLPGVISNFLSRIGKEQQLPLQTL